MATDAEFDAFVVYVSTDRARAGALVEALRTDGRRVFWDQDLQPGDDWSVALPHALQSARTVLVVISPVWPLRGEATRDGWYARQEIAEAIGLARQQAQPPRVIPVIFEGAHARLHYGLSTLVPVEVPDGHASVAAAALRAVFDGDEDGPGAMSPPPPGDPHIARRLIEHPRYRRRLTGFRRFLTEAELPFQPPPDDHPCHPDVLWARLRDRPAERGVLLYGFGGVGKTRTAFEVAERADAAGWRVLHVEPGERHLDAHQVVDALAERPHPTLLVFDYIDQLQDFDLGALARRRPEAGAPLAILGNSRPRWLSGREHEFGPLLEPIELDPDAEQRGRLLALIGQRVAPQARAQLGADVLGEICGQRPIIALLIALQVEQRAQAGPLDQAWLAGVRRDDLLYWLRDRLQRDQVLGSAPARGLRPPATDSYQLAAAAALAAAPQSRVWLFHAAGATLSARSERPDGSYPVELLLGMGWLEFDEPYVRSAHDVVVDEVCQQSIAPGGVVLRDQLDALLAGTLLRARHLGRFALALTRSTTSSSHPSYSAALAADAARWWRLEQAGLRTVLLADDPDAAGYALGAVFGGSLWNASAFETWDAVVGAWLRVHGTSPHARHLLYKGLRSVADEDLPRLVEAAEAWLSVNGCSPDATFVLRPLLTRLPADAAEATTAVRAALQWLAANDNGTVSEAQFVLNALLERSDLDRPLTLEALGRALAWLSAEGNGTSAVARFVLRPLLARTDLASSAVAEAVERALTWLSMEGNGLSSEAGFVLDPLLRRSDLGASAGSKAVKLAMAWLSADGNGLATDAQFVLNSLLGRSDLGEAGTPAVARALAWLSVEGNAASADAGFVLPRLLGRHDLGSAGVEVVGRTLAWLSAGRNGLSSSAQFVLNPLLARRDLGSAGTAAIGRALAWLSADGHGLSPDAGFVLTPLLARSDLGAAGSEAVVRALSWLSVDGHGMSIDAGFVLNPLLGRCDLASPDGAATLAHARGWLLAHGTELDGQFVLRALLDRTSPGWVIEAARVWVEVHGDSPAADFVYKALLRRPDVPPSVVAAAYRWLCTRAAELEIDFIFNRLLAHESLTVDEWRHVADIALGWLDRVRPSRACVYTLGAFTRRQDLMSADHCRRWTEHARRILRRRVPGPMWIIRLIVELGQRIERGELPLPGDPSAEA